MPLLRRFLIPARSLGDIALHPKLPLILEAKVHLPRRDRHPARHRRHVDALDEAGKEGRVDASGDDVEIDEGEPVLQAQRKDRL